MPAPIVFIYSPRYVVDIGVHVFRTEKYALVERALRAGLRVAPDLILEPVPPSDEELARALDPEYLADLKAARETPRTAWSELPIRKPVIEANVLGAGGTLLAAREALRMPGIGFHVGGGLHHAFPGRAEGFCYVNDVGVAITALKDEGAIRRGLVVDCDLHQGNGTAFYFRDDPDVFTFSIHQENLYPIKQRSDLDIGLEDFTGDGEYLTALATAIPRLYDSHRPDIVFYLAGADPFEQDQLGSLRLTKDGLRKRDELVICEAVARRIPLAILLAGGYAVDLNDTVAIHVGTARVAMEEAGRRG